MLDAAARGLRGLINLTFPADCRICNTPLTNVTRIPVCAACLREPEPIHTEYACVACRMPFVNPYPLDAEGKCALCRLGATGFDAVYAYGSYEATLRTLIHLFKYEKIHPLAKPLAGFMARVLPREERFDCVVPVPIHWRRRLERGFNQSELLAQQIARRWNVPVRQMIERRKSTTPQAGLTNSKRRANVRGAFALKGPWWGRFGRQMDRKPLMGMRVLLIDDVLTTGATASACARILKRAGAKHVALATVGRTDRRLGLDTSDQGKAKSGPAAGFAAAGLSSAGLNSTGLFSNEFHQKEGAARSADAGSETL
jgi:ComF family protein